MNELQKTLIDRKIDCNSIWFMRQAGRYLPEFREIRKLNPDFIKLCLNENLSTEITLQPLKRFDLDAAIIFSDILMLPYGLNQKVEFKKNFGPLLGDLDLNEISKISEENFFEKIYPVYNAIKLVSTNQITHNKSTIGFIGAPWTLLVYMINKKSPKLRLMDNFFEDKILIKKTLKILNKFLKIHIKNQIDNGAEIIQIFDSWAGLLHEKNLEEYIYSCTYPLVEYTKSLNVPVICFPRGIKNYKTYCDIVKPDVICIDYEVDPLKVQKEIKIPVQGGLDPKILLTNLENLKKETRKYLEIFKDQFLINRLLAIIEKFLKVHIRNQVEAGAKVIQIFDSWAGLLEDKIPEYIYIPTLNIVEYTKQLGVPVICFPRGIKDYKNFCEIVKPDAVNIDYDVDPKKIVKEIKIPIQGGLDPKILLSDKETLKKEVERYLHIFKDHPYIFNLGHGILPETKIEMVENLIKIVRDFK